MPYRISASVMAVVYDSARLGQLQRRTTSFGSGLISSATTLVSTTITGRGGLAAPGWPARAIQVDAADLAHALEQGGEQAARLVRGPHRLCEDGTDLGLDRPTVGGRTDAEPLAYLVV